MVDPRFSILVLAILLLLLLLPSSDACAKTCGCKEWPPKDPSDEDKVGGFNRIPAMFIRARFPVSAPLTRTLLLPAFPVRASERLVRVLLQRCAQHVLERRKCRPL